MIIGSQNSVHAMDSSKSKFNTAKALKAVASTVTIAGLYIHSQSYQPAIIVQSPVENSLRNFADSQYQAALQHPVMNNNNQGYYYLRGSAASFDCDDEGCTHKKLALFDCDDDDCKH